MRHRPPGRGLRHRPTGRARLAAAALLLGAGLCLAACAGAAETGRTPEAVYPRPTDYVVDAAGLLDPGARAHLVAVCHELEEKTGVQLAAALVPSIAPLDIDSYAVELFRRWGVGHAKQDNGVLLVVARDERRVRVEVGYGLEGLLPDGRVGGILRGAVVPHLRQNDWNGGVTGGIESLAAVIAADRGVALATLGASQGQRLAQSRPRRERLPFGAIAVLIFFVIMMVVRVSTLGPQSRRRGSWARLGGLGGFGGGFGGGGFSGGGGFGGFGGGGSGGGGASSGF
jgi:uncharacterized protein